MHKRLCVFAALLNAGCLAYEAPLPTAPTAVVVEARTPFQMIVRVVGPSGWYPDRIYVDAFVFDQKGTKLDGVVRCDVSRGRLEPAQWDTTHRSGTLWLDAATGASFTCRSIAVPAVEASYVTTPLDFEMPRGCCGGTQPAPPKPPTVTPPVVPPSPGSGS